MNQEKTSICCIITQASNQICYTNMPLALILFLTLIVFDNKVKFAPQHRKTLRMSEKVINRRASIKSRGILALR